MYKIYLKKTKESKLFLSEILKKYHCQNDIFYNENGKPYLKNSDLFFNISHSGDYTVVVISDKEVGVDMQKLTYRKRVIDKYFTEDEKKICHDARSFTKIWVKKESYLKFLGKGIGYGLKKIDTTKIKGYKLKKYKNYYIAIYF